MVANHFIKVVVLWLDFLQFSSCQIFSYFLREKFKYKIFLKDVLKSNRSDPTPISLLPPASYLCFLRAKTDSGAGTFSGR